MHAAATECDPLAPVVVMRTVRTPLESEYDDADEIDELIDEVGYSLMSDAMKLEAYEAWQARGRLEACGRFLRTADARVWRGSRLSTSPAR